MFTFVFIVTLVLFFMASVFSVLTIITDNEDHEITTKFLFPVAVVSFIILGIIRIFYSSENGIDSIASGIWGYFYLFSFTLILVILYLYFSKWKKQWKSFMIIMIPFITFILAISIPFINSPRKVIIELNNRLLENHVLPVHIFFTMLGELFFFLSFVGSILYLLMEWKLRKKTSMMLIYKLPNLETIERFNSWSIARSFTLLTIGVIIGMVMALWNYQTLFLGTAKEMHIYFSWAIILAIYIVRKMKKVVSRKVNLVNAILFIIIMFLFIFTNIYITKGFHGYK